MLSDYFARIAGELNRKSSRPSTGEEAVKWIASLREKLWAAMMVDPMKCDLNASVLARSRRRGYIVENVVFESRSGFYVTGNLYLPEGNGVFPAVLQVHGHYPRGKSELHVQAIGATLAKAGFVVLALGTVGYGDRYFQGHLDGARLPAVGMSLPGLILWDNIRALDYLCSRKEVDPSRIGVTGSSGGGNQAVYLAAIDERVK